MNFKDFLFNSQITTSIAAAGYSAPTPIQISGLSNITALSASDKINLVLDSDGNVWTWGSNPAGFGDGTTDTIKPNPMQVPDVTGITAVGCGYYGHFLAVKSNKTVLKIVK